MKDEIILVIGASGLLGKELIKQLLLQDKMVRATYNNTPLQFFSNSNLQIIKCDILNEKDVELAMKGVSYVYHCAAMVSFSAKNKTQMFKINVDGTTNVVNAAIIANIKKMIYVSSVAALGKSKNNEPITENTIWTSASNHSQYGLSKYLAEKEIWRGIDRGLNVVIVNPVIILGYSNWDSGSAQIFKNVFNQFPWYSTGTTGFVDVYDVAKAMIKLLESKVTAQQFIVSAQTKSFKDIFILIAKGFNKKPPYKKVTLLIANIVWRLLAIKSFFTKKNPLVTKETSTAALSMLDYDNSKLLKQLPDFSYLPIEKSIENICNQFKQKLNNK